MQSSLTRPHTKSLSLVSQRLESTFLFLKLLRSIKLLDQLQDQSSDNQLKVELSRLLNNTASKDYSLQLQLQLKKSQQPQLQLKRMLERRLPQRKKRNVTKIIANRNDFSFGFSFCDDGSIVIGSIGPVSDENIPRLIFDEDSTFRRISSVTRLSFK